MDNRIAFFSEVLSLAFKFGLLFGGAILLFYGWGIGYIPKDISLSDGLLFTSLAIMFGLVYLFFVLSITSLGIFLRPIWHGLQNTLLQVVTAYKKLRKKKFVYQAFIIEKGKTPFLFFAFPGFLFFIGVASQNLFAAFQLTLCTWACAFLWSVYQQANRKINSFVVVDDLTTIDNERIKRLKVSQFFVLLALLVVPLIYGGTTGVIVDGVMRLSNFRVDLADVHIKQPYVTFANEHGLVGQPSIFGADFQKFDKVKVLLHRVGTDVVIERLNDKGRSQTLIIPADHIYIIESTQNGRK